MDTNQKGACINAWSFRNLEGAHGQAVMISGGSSIGKGTHAGIGWVFLQRGVKGAGQTGAFSVVAAYLLYYEWLCIGKDLASCTAVKGEFAHDGCIRRQM